MDSSQSISLKRIFKAFPGRISATWSLVLLENLFLALIPLVIGMAIDGLLAGRIAELYWLGGVLVGLTVTAVLRRMYDTRTYGVIRIRLGSVLHSQQPHLPVSSQSARLDMARELVDFFEQELPECITAVVQIVITLSVLTVYDYRLALSAVAMTVGILLVYCMFHKYFFRINKGLNSQKERQVTIIGTRSSKRIARHLMSMRNWEVRLSDAEAWLYGFIFLMVTAFIMYNLWISAYLDNVTAGRLFTIISYSWEYVEAVIALPNSLMLFTRIREITERIACKPEGAS